MSARSRDRTFAARIVAWQAESGRRGLPWQGSRDPYRIWLSEVMLQQTQVAAVLPYFRRFCARFPDVTALALAPLADVLSLWSGLGYYARARNLHACARQVVERFSGRFPQDARALAQLPGIGRSTAAAIAAFCFDERAPILDGNVKRVLTRYFGIEGNPGSSSVERELWSLAESLLPRADVMPAYTQGLMDLGATLCRRRAPACAVCPLQRGCKARRDGRIDELPASRSRKVLPQRATWMLLSMHAGQVLLQRRAPAGIWGGLLAPPQFDSFDSLRQAARALAAAADPLPLAPRRHAFTHFTLMLHPYLLDLSRLPTLARDDDQEWLSLAGIDSAALPAPIRALLREVCDGASSTAASNARLNRMQ